MSKSLYETKLTHLTTNNFYISKSRLVQYFVDCERKYYFSYVLGYSKFNVNAWNYLGTIKHELFYEILRGLKNNKEFLEDYSIYKSVKKFVDIFGLKFVEFEQNHRHKIGTIHVDGKAYSVFVNGYTDIIYPDAVIDLKSRLSDKEAANLEAKFYQLITSLSGYNFESAVTYGINDSNYWVFEYNPFTIEEMLSQRQQ